MGARGHAVTKSSLTEETPSTPGWVDARIREVFAAYGPGVEAARDAYADCLAGVRGAVDVDLGHDRCRRTALAAVEGIVSDIPALDHALQALEAEISNST